ncbi:MAG TPA: dephospho-CoA kinase [Candidatus Kapabacteria bacterium]|nr:dephospho-CoA kinase [Candidatus Kapabacteria bacterium]
MRAIRIGITGKLASGKSLLVSMIEARGAFAIRSDDLARDLMERDPALRAKLSQILGPKAFVDGKLDRTYIASQIFGGTSQAGSLRHAVEAAVHPATTAEIERIFEAHPNEMVAVESALILSSRFRERFDYIILVESPDADAVARVTQEGRMSKADAEARLAEQASDPIARDEADFILENSGTKADFEKKCEKLLDVLEALRNRQLPDEPLHAEGIV